MSTHKIRDVQKHEKYITINIHAVVMYHNSLNFLPLKEHRTIIVI